MDHTKGFQYINIQTCGPGSVVAIATGWTVRDRIPVAARFSAPVQTCPGAHPVSCTMGTGSFPGVKSGQGVRLTPHLLVVPLVMKEYSYTSTPPMGPTAYTEPQCLYKGALYLYLIHTDMPT
jgi:hypothetical protein